MITNIPDAEDFQNIGRDYLNMAWDEVCGLLLGLSEHEEYLSNDAKESLSNDADELSHYREVFWKNSQRRLAVSSTLVVQAAEFLLKGKIALVSPYLLLVDPGNWPAGCAEADTSFADLKTVDAQILTKIHDAVCAERLSDRFKTRLQEMRQLRNRLMHSVDNALRLEAVTVIRNILACSHELVGPSSWSKMRRVCVEQEGVDAEGKLVILGNYEYKYIGLSREFAVVIDLLMPAECRDWLDFPKSARRYWCPHCYNSDLDFESYPQIAVLDPPRGKATEVYCIACAQRSAVSRSRCIAPYCKGNVLSEELECCLTCGQTQRRSVKAPPTQ